MTPLAEGKLPLDLLQRLLRHTSQAPGRARAAEPRRAPARRWTAAAARSPQLIIGADPGEDAAVAVGSQTIVLTADPITFTADRLGTYVVAVNANDIVAMGGRPAYLTTTVLLSPGTTEDELEKIFADIADACRRNGLLWVGGHTEVTPVVTRAVVCGQAVGFLSGQPLSTAGARPGDALCMTKWAGLEGSTTIARERPSAAREALGESGHAAVLEWLDRPGISIVEEGRALEGLLLTSGHDPTEGGVAMGIHEICRASGVGVVVRREAICVKEETRRLCERFAMDPLGLLSSGVFLFTAPPDVAVEACRRVRKRGIPAEIVGRIEERGAGEWLEKEDGRVPLVFSQQDQIVKLQS
jgi:hydrogenase expression/formation protein HypE